jgi:rRNA maturation RNase YbeY
MNKRFFEKDYPTNVISFSYLDGPGYEVMGDIVVSLEKAREEADSLSIPFYERLFDLIIHGIVHILGYDHVNEAKEARRMRYREKRLRAFVVAHPLYQQLIGGSV